MIPTEFRDSNGDIICIGHELDIIASNHYNGIVNEVNGEILLQTAFFNKPLKDHLTAIDIVDVSIHSDLNLGNCFFCGKSLCGCECEY